MGCGAPRPAPRRPPGRPLPPNGRGGNGGRGEEWRSVGELPPLLTGCYKNAGCRLNRSTSRGADCRVAAAAPCPDDAEAVGLQRVELQPCGRRQAAYVRAGLGWTLSAVIKLPSPWHYHHGFGLCKQDSQREKARLPTKPCCDAKWLLFTLLNCKKGHMYKPELTCLYNYTGFWFVTAKTGRLVGLRFCAHRPRVQINKILKCEAFYRI